jgi:crossover junction endodeoxyribonuclease RuvC
VSDDAMTAARLTPAPGTGIIVLGIDPGSVVTGYGIVYASGAEVAMLGCGAVRPKGDSVSQRLLSLYERLRELVAEWSPDEVAIEEPFTRVNAHSAFVLGKAQAAAILAVAHAGLPVFEYTPAAVKQAVASYGRAGKSQVQEMVRLQFGLATAPQPPDAADALAVALCHLAHRRTAAMMRETNRR